MISNKMRSTLSYLCALLHLATILQSSNGSYPEEYFFCNEPITPENGYRVGNHFGLGYGVRFGCNPGYYLVGSEVIFCVPGEFDVHWNEEPPVCLPEEPESNCSHPLNPGTNAVLTASTESTASYACRDDSYVPSGGKAVIQCVDREWQGEPLSCRLKAVCSDFGSITNGFRHIRGNLEDDLVTFFCEDGYALMGVSEAKCLSNGEWSASWPTCVRVLANCSSPGSPNNGGRTLVGMREGDIAQYFCNSGYELDGDRTRTCQSDGEWSGTTPHCTRRDCGSPKMVAFSSVVYNSTLYESTATYNCDAGYAIIGLSTVMCLATGVWSGIPLCVPISCSHPPTISNGQVTYNAIVFKSIARYKCDRGYNPGGVTEIMCGSDGQWNPQPPVCTPVQCDSLADPENGHVQLMSTVYLSLAQYSCLPGYELNGSEYLRCESDGNWSSVPPVCSPKRCSLLTKPENGQLNLTGTTFGSLAQYSCDPGFELFGTEVRLCETSGAWTGAPARCERIKCQDLVAPNNGVVSFGSTLPGSLAVYMCNQGYLLFGDGARTCRDDGTWTGVEPTCNEIIFCDRLIAPDGGIVIVSGTIIGSYAKYGCIPGYELDGDQQRFCLINGSWSGEEPKCILVGCRDLPDPANGHVTITGITIGSEATYACDLGHNLVGNITRDCIDPGTGMGLWTGMEPQCIVVDCGAPSSRLSVIVDYSTTTFNSIANYSCPNESVLIGVEMVVCQEDGSWSHPPPQCMPRRDIICDTLNPPANGTVSFTTAFGSVAVYTCNDGFRLVGVELRRCQSNSQWSDEAPLCEKILCPQLFAPTNGTLNVNSQEIGSMAFYDCNRGFVLFGDGIRTCKDDGQWSGREPYCQVIVYCPAVKSPANGYVVYSGRTVGSFAKYRCKSGYTLNGLSTRICQADTTWTGMEPTCNKTLCSELSAPLNGFLNTSGREVGSSASYECKSGFVLIGDDSRMCGGDGQWSGTEPSCEVIGYCPVILPPTNGSVVSSSTIVGSLVTYTCDMGFRLNGPSTRVCQTNESWTGSEPTCELIDCGNPPETDNGNVAISGTRLGAIATYFCTDQFTLVGEEMRTCLENGEWSGNTPVCQSADCGLLPSIANAEIQYPSNSTSKGSQAIYKCFPGYILQGDAERLCQDDIQWSGTQPFCQAVDCGHLNSPKNGRLVIDNTTLANPARYSCNVGFNLIGEEIRVCTITGNWSGSEPTCEIIDCGSLASPDNGSVNISGTIFTSTATYSCIFGYRLDGPGLRFCTDSGMWLPGPEPVCSFVDCMDPGTPANGKRTLSSTFLGATVNYTCNNNFELVGDRNRTCEEDGWSGGVPTCREVDCGEPGPIENGVAFFFGTTVGMAVTYRCNTGFELSGTDRRICQSNGLWSLTEPVCIDIRPHCGDPGAPANGMRTFSDDVPGSVVMYTCNPRYRLVPEGQIQTCGSDGQWSPEQPICELFSCPSLGIPDNGQRINSNFTFGEVVYFVCQDDYDLVGSSARVCQADSGSWSGTSASCIRRNSTCNGSGEVFDNIGRRCMCVNDSLVNCCRYRRDWLSLTLDERQRYTSAVLTVSSDPLYLPRYTYLMNKYFVVQRTSALGSDIATSQFLPWHRFFFQQIEDLLRMLDPTIFIPYWDWTLLNTAPYTHPVFNASSGFGRSADDNSCVSDGPFQVGQFSLTSVSGGGCLKRNYFNVTFASRESLEDGILMNSPDEFDLFLRIAGRTYERVICSIGGTMCSINEAAATEDPLHILIISFIDEVWSQWQGFSEEHKNVPYANDNNLLAKTDDLTVSHYHDNENLPNGAAVCYEQPLNFVTGSNSQKRETRAQSADRGHLSSNTMSKLGEANKVGPLDM